MGLDAPGRRVDDKTPDRGAASRSLVGVCWSGSWPRRTTTGMGRWSIQRPLCPNRPSVHRPGTPDLYQRASRASPDHRRSVGRLTHNPKVEGRTRGTTGHHRNRSARAEPACLPSLVGPGLHAHTDQPISTRGGAGDRVGYSTRVLPVSSCVAPASPFHNVLAQRRREPMCLAVVRSVAGGGEVSRCRVVARVAAARAMVLIGWFRCELHDPVIARDALVGIKMKIR